MGKRYFCCVHLPNAQTLKQPKFRNPPNTVTEGNKSFWCREVRGVELEQSICITCYSKYTNRTRGELRRVDTSPEGVKRPLLLFN